MRTDLLVALTAVAAVAAVTTLVSLHDERSSGSGAEPPSAPSCIQYWPEARYRPFGFDHVVHVMSTCTRDAMCAVSTNVDPDPVNLFVPSRSAVEVVTRTGSPAREFTPFLACRFEGNPSVASAPVVSRVP